MQEPLSLKSINDLLGEHFFISHYQRGYRWTKQQVTDLLEDIWAFATNAEDNQGAFYCLQPIVLKRRTLEISEANSREWEVIDGQQRLTTIYIILTYLTKEYLRAESLLEDYHRVIYSVRYETREQSEAFLKNISDDNSNIDFHYISSAYRTVSDWFRPRDRNEKNQFLVTLLGKKSDKRSVQVIWYQTSPSVNSVELFTRLNMGKIPLTNAELIKALFLSSSSFRDECAEDVARKKIEISQIWDGIEQTLADNHFWSFVTNKRQGDFATKIELVFDLLSERSEREIDPLYTFLYFLRRSGSNAESLWQLWLKIEQYFLTLRDWYLDKNLYHKVGYLVAVGEPVNQLIKLSMSLRKSQFEAHLDQKISNHLGSVEIAELSYENNTHYKRIENLLILFNVESIRSNPSILEFYPFDFHKRTNWSLEHIHAQNSESLDQNRKEGWFKWLHFHKALIQELLTEDDDLVDIEALQVLHDDITSFDNDKLTWEKFGELSKRVIEMFSEGGVDSVDDLHSVSNLALLSQADNSALNNSVFEVKRREIIKMDKEGKYIPICTKRVFFKYFNDKPSTQHYYFWGQDDRKSYLEAIRSMLKPYLPNQMEARQ